MLVNSKCTPLIQKLEKIKKWPVCNKFQNSDKNEWSESNFELNDKKQKNIEEHENDILVFLELMEMHGYNGAKKIS